METFVVRVWTPSPDLTAEISQIELRGTVERVGTNEQSQFHTGSELLEILAAMIVREPALHLRRIKRT